MDLRYLCDEFPTCPSEAEVEYLLVGSDAAAFLGFSPNKKASGRWKDRADLEQLTKPG